MYISDIVQFRKLYLGWGMSEPWERQNFERFFILSSFMNKYEMNWIFYADSDVIVKIPITLDMFFSGEANSCSSFLSLQQESEIMLWETLDWVAWAGTGLLEKNVLSDFCKFVLKFYESPSLIDILLLKKDKMPYICDMTLWYLYSGFVDHDLREKWKWPTTIALNADPVLFNISAYKLCDILNYGFNHMHGHVENIDYKSLHFQGGAKNELIEWVKNHVV